MNLIEQVKIETARWITTTGHDPDFVIFGNQQYTEYNLLCSVLCCKPSERIAFTFMGLDVIHAANKESCILFGKYADSQCG